MTTKREFAYLAVGIGIGVAVPKLVPKLGVVKAVKYFKEVFEARKRLQKIVIEEYYRIEEAIEAEEAFLKMINPNVTITSQPISFKITDDEGQRGIHLHIGPEPKI